MDLESYIGRYTGETRLRRLLSVALGGAGGETTTGGDGNGNGNGNGHRELRKQALKLVEQQLLRDGNALLYRDIFGGGMDSRRIVDPELFEGIRPYDADWANATEHSNRETRRVLEGRLSTAKSRLHKEAIRTAYLALAEHDVRTSRDNHKSLANPVGTSASTSTSTSQPNASESTAHHYNNNNKNAINARKALYSAMECCTSRIQTAEIGLLIIESALNAGDYAVAKEYTERLESTLLRDNKDPNQDSILSQIGIKVQIARGIERMISGDYHKAANALFAVVMMGSGEGGSSSNNNTNNETNPHSHSQGSNEYHKLHWPGVTAPEDVALYAGLMCLVTRNRPRMMTLADHPEALELVPSVRELLVHWCRANYAPCMRALSMDVGTTDRSRSSLLRPLLPMGMPVDAYLTPSRWNSMVRTLRETCLVEYLRPYERVKLDGLRDLLFPSSPLDGGGSGSETAMDALVDFVADLMDRELLPPTTRLDCREWVLFRTEAPTDPTPNLQAMEEKILDDTHAMLVRLACLEHDLGSNNSDGTSYGGKRGKKGQKGGRRYPRRGNNHHHRGQQHHQSQSQSISRGMAESSESEDDDVFDFSHEKRGEGGGTGAGAGGDMSDTHMIDADTSQPNSAMNPEDMY